MVRELVATAARSVRARTSNLAFCSVTCCTAESIRSVSRFCVSSNLVLTLTEVFRTVSTAVRSSSRRPLHSVRRTSSSSSKACDSTEIDGFTRDTARRERERRLAGRAQAS